MYRKKRTYRPKKKVDKKQNRAIAKLKRDSYEKDTTIVLRSTRITIWAKPSLLRRFYIFQQNI
eukprot:COSAG02_NODE_72088_length_188_cov_17.741573_1_plen_62_part_11